MSMACGSNETCSISIGLVPQPSNNPKANLANGVSWFRAPKARRVQLYVSRGTLYIRVPRELNSYEDLFLKLLDRFGAVTQQEGHQLCARAVRRGARSQGGEGLEIGVGRRDGPLVRRQQAASGSVRLPVSQAVSDCGGTQTMSPCATIGSIAGSSASRADNRPNYRGALTIEQDLPAGSKLWLSAWSKEDPAPWISISVEVAVGGPRKRGKNKSSQLVERTAKSRAVMRIDGVSHVRSGQGRQGKA